MTYKFPLCFYTLFQSFRAQSIIGECTSRHFFPYGGLQAKLMYGKLSHLMFVCYLLEMVPD